MLLICVCFTFPAIQTALRLHSEGKSSHHHELKLKRRVQRENSQRERSRSARSSRSSQSDDSNIHEVEKMDKEKDRQDLEIESIIQVRLEEICRVTVAHNAKLCFKLAGKDDTLKNMFM